MLVALDQKQASQELQLQYDNGSKKVDTILLTPTPLTKANIDLLEKDGFYTKEQIGL